MKKTDLIQKLKQLDGLTPDERATLIDLVNTRKKYGLVWEDKPEEVEEQLRDNLPVLREVKDKAILNGDENPNHILIEGDNLHALTALTFTHEGRIDVIYIDPPYNTGNNDFKYHDAFKDEAEFVDREHKFRHSTWLSFMSKRLKIAKRLLNEDGLIFLSIDDNEIAQLKLLCDEVFDEKNFVANICQKSRHSISNDLILSDNHNYLLFYCKKYEKLFSRRKEFRLEKEVDESKFKNPDNDPKGPYKIHPVDGPGGARKGNPHYEFLGVNGFWRYSFDTMKKLYDDGEIVKRKNTIGRKYYLSHAKLNNKESVTTWWDDVGTTTEGTKTLKEIIPVSDFTNPKPVSLLDRILNLSTNKNKDAVILDFFGGSGTTLHATIKYNAEDGGNRQCILVTNNENNICEEVTYERNKRVIQGYTNSKGENVAGLTNNNLRYFRSEFVGRETSVKNKKEITRLATELLCIKEDIYTEQKDIGDYQLNATYVRCFQQGDLYLLVIYDEEVIEQVVEVILNVVEQSKDAKPQFKVYVFSNCQYPYTEEFEDVLEYVTLCALPDAIYKAYQNVLPKRQRKVVPELEEPTAEEVEEILTLDNEQDLFS